jgi:DNA-binding NarL/FixJ family response regulator
VHRDAGAPGDAIARAALSPREGEVLRCIAAGDSNEMIARALNRGPHTVKRHVANIPDKLGSRDAVRQLDSRSPSFVGDGLQALRRRRDGAAAD